MRMLAYALLLVLLLLGAGFALLLSTGAINVYSLRMIANVAFGTAGHSRAQSGAGEGYRLPPGFHLQVYADHVPRARFLRFTPAGDLLVSRPHAGDIVLLRRDENGDGRHDGMETLITGLNRPQGLDFYRDWLYIAERDRVGRVRFRDGRTAGDYQPVITGLSGDGNHWSKTLRFGPDDMLYLSQGSTCNVCEEADPRRATIMRFAADGSGGEIFASGLRNSVGFDWAPWNGALYATDNGRDMLGDDFPVCELNRVEQGRFYGWPYFNDANVPDPDMGPDPLAGARQPTPPVHGFRPHNAPLGINFVDSGDWPGDYQRVALVALHGSWNRSSPDGYKVVSLHFGESGIEERDFVSGFNRRGKIVGRPVDVIQGPDGALYISDDYAGAVYRVALGQAAAGSTASVTVPRLDTAPPAWLDGADLPAMAARGETLYRNLGCGACHDQGIGAVSLRDLSQRLGYTAVIDTLEAPRPPMPLLPLSEQQKRELAIFLLQNHN